VTFFGGFLHRRLNDAMMVPFFTSTHGNNTI